MKACDGCESGTVREAGYCAQRLGECGDALKRALGSSNGDWKYAVRQTATMLAECQSRLSRIAGQEA